MTDATFWRGRKVLVTGHTGFKGSWLVLWLRELGAEVTGLALAPPTEPSLFEAARVADGIRSLEGDVRDLGAVERALREARPEVVLHLAAQSLVRESYADPVGTYATNVMGTVHVLEGARRVSGVRAVVVVTTDKCYENREWAWPYRENDPLGGRDPYSSSKACAELVTAAYDKSFLEKEGIAVASVRAGNVIGGGDWARDRLVPDAVRAFLRGEKVRLRNPLATRPWQHVLEPVSVYLRLARGLVESPGRCVGAWNVGPDAGDVRPVAGVVEALASHFGPAAGWEKDGADHPHEARALALDASKARQLLGWTPRLRLDEALGWTARWYRDVAGGADARAATLADVERFTRIG